MSSRAEGGRGTPRFRRDRLDPHPWQADYIQLRALAVQMRNRIECLWPHDAGIRVADIGCGDRPYEPLFAGRAAEYVGVDPIATEHADVVAFAHDLPFGDREFDCVLNTGVLQLVSDPLDTLRELQRVLVSNGTLFLSAHGVGFTDRASTDRWRWTQHGLATLFANVGGWAEVEVLPAGGVLSAAAYLVGGQAEFAAHRIGVTGLAAPVCLALNALGWRADMVVRRLFPDLPPDASVNYLVVARRR